MNYILSKSKGTKVTIGATKKKRGATVKAEVSESVLVTTAAKANVLLNSAIDSNLCGTITAVTLTTTEKVITSDKIANLCSNIDNLKITMKRRLLEIYNLIIE